MINKAEIIQKGAMNNLKPDKVLATLKKNLKLLGLDWYNNYFKRFKFSTSAQNKYHLQQRKANYIRRMKKEHGAWQPFVVTGKLRAAALSGANVKPNTKGTDLDVDIKIKRGHATPKYVSLELITVLKQEIKEMINFFTKKTTDDIKGK